MPVHGVTGTAHPRVVSPVERIRTSGRAFQTYTNTCVSAIVTPATYRILQTLITCLNVGASQTRTLIRMDCPFHALSDWKNSGVSIGFDALSRRAAPHARALSAVLARVPRVAGRLTPRFTKVVPKRTPIALEISDISQALMISLPPAVVLSLTGLAVMQFITIRTSDALFASIAISKALHFLFDAGFAALLVKA